MEDRLNMKATTDATVVRGAGVAEEARLRGRFFVQCFDKDGRLKWEDEVLNTVVTVGKNLSLDTILGGAAYTVTGPFMGLIALTSFTAIAAGDTMASHGGWLEAGLANAPTYTGNRKTAVFGAAAAGVKALSAALSFAITADGTIKGTFIVFGTGAVNTKDDTNGVLLSAGLFSGGDKVLSSGDTLNASYSLAL